jgi:hypothetical protein
MYGRVAVRRMLRQKDAVIDALRHELRVTTYLVAHASSMGYRAPDVDAPTPPETRTDYAGLSRGELAYHLKASGKTWGEVALEMRLGEGKAARDTATGHARLWAKRNHKPWPLTS